MPLTVGTRLGPYEILSLLGAGGMGEVYKARDTRLDRTVAVKVLPELLAADPQFRERFDREARAISQLPHPHICTLHDVGEQDGTAFLVMEYLDGETLADRLTKGALPLDEALKIAIQIADALGAAHRQGIVHRDLKPGNVMLAMGGGAKLLDFGLAKASTMVAGAGLSMLPTTPPNLTAQGTILGTFQDMAPEQLEGQDADARTDIFAFGAVLFEMITGKRAFEGKSHASLIGAIMHADPPPVSLMQLVASASLDRVVATCLAKDPDDRWQSARDLKRELSWVADHAVSLDSGAAFSSPAEPGSVRSRARVWRLVAVAAGLGLATFTTLTWRSVNHERPTPVYASLDTPADWVLGEDDALVHLPTRTPMVFTPDGRSLIILVARAGTTQLVLRSLDRPDARPIAGTDGAHVPFVSPDGRWVGFQAANEIRKVPIEGGAPTTICSWISSLGPIGAAWGTQDVIVFGDAATGRIMRVYAGGGTPAFVTSVPVARRLHVAPFFLPDGAHFLFSDVSVLDANDARVMVQALDGGDAKSVLASATDARLLPTGQLAFMRLGTLMTVAFNLARAEVIGAPVAVVSGVMQSGLRARAGANNTGAGMFTVSSHGDLAVVRGPVIGGEENHLVWVTRDGRSSSAEPSSGAPSGARLYRRISPDGSRAIMTVITRTRFEVWIADWKRDVWTLCGDCPFDTFLSPIWSPDGRRVVFPAREKLVAHDLGGAMPDQIIVREADRILEPRAWLADGRLVYMSRPIASSSTSLEVKLLDAGASAGRVLVPAGAGLDAELSPDHQWLAYTAIQAGQHNIVVQPFPGPGARTPVSSGGGDNAVWSADGRTLYFLRVVSNNSWTIALAADIAAREGTVSVGTPRELFVNHEAQMGIGREYDISDGPRFLFEERAPSVKNASVTRLDLVLNWTSTLPTAR